MTTGRRPTRISQALGLTDGRLTRDDRIELENMVKLRTKVAKGDVDTRMAYLRAEFEQEMATIYKAKDERWRHVVEAAAEAAERANAEIQKICEDNNIPQDSRPSMSNPLWFGRGENASKERRAELRKVAETRLDAMAKQAKGQIDRDDAMLRLQITAMSVTTQQAMAFLEALPSIEQLMRALDVQELEAAVPESWSG